MDSDHLLEGWNSGSPEDGLEQKVDAEVHRNHFKSEKRHYGTVATVMCLVGVISLVLILLYRGIDRPNGSLRPIGLTYFLEDSDQETVLVPFSHDWTGLLEIEDPDIGYRYADSRWEKTFPESGGTVALPRQLQVELGLDLRSAETPESSSNFHYMIAGYHQLHCLSVVRDALYYLNGTLEMSSPFLWDHVLHCVEAVRQALFCFLDPTLIPLDDWWPGIPNDQKHVCRNSEALARWSDKYAHATPDSQEIHADSLHTEEWLDRHNH